MNSKKIRIENPSELGVEGGRVAWNWKIMYLAETDRYYEFHLTEAHIAPNQRGISIWIFKKTKLLYNPQSFTPDHCVEILFEPHSKQVTKTMELGKFRRVNAVIMCMMDGIQEVNKI